MESILKFENGINFVRLIDQISKNWEGFKMGHCVSSYSNHKGIYSIRDKENVPHCTIEIKNNYIQQIKGKANGKISPKYIDYVLKSLVYFNYGINEKEMSNLGYIKLTKEIKKSFANLKTVKFKNKEYVYLGNQWKISNHPILCEDVFFTICRNGNNIDYIKWYLLNKKDIINQEKGIVHASANGHVKIVKELLKDKRIDPSFYENCSIRNEITEKDSNDLYNELCDKVNNYRIKLNNDFDNHQIERIMNAKNMIILDDWLMNFSQSKRYLDLQLNNKIQIIEVYDSLQNNINYES